jgi:hypothetical protein
MTDTDRELGVIAARIDELFRRQDRTEEMLVANTKAQHENSVALNGLLARLPDLLAARSEVKAPVGLVAAVATIVSAAATAASQKLMSVFGLH